MAAPKMKKGSTPKTIKEGQPQAVPLRYAMAAGITPAASGKSTTKKGK